MYLDRPSGINLRPDGARRYSPQKDYLLQTIRKAMLPLVCASVLVAAPAQPDDQEAKLASWYQALGSPRSSESFGSYLVRGARLQHGVKYAETSPPPGHETLRIHLDTFECVSFIESALAVARCGWQAEPTTACFVKELEASRYRAGKMAGYSSRLHYFVDWIADNEARGRLVNLTESLGGEPVRKDFFYISERVLPRSSLPPEELEALASDIRATERELSVRAHSVLSRVAAPPVLGGLEDGDLVAIVRERPGLLVHHGGFVYWSNGTPRLMHASSYHGRVVITVQDVADYLLRRPERRGVIVARPLPPR